MSERLRIELLSFDDCPNRDVALQRLHAAIDAECITEEVTEVYVKDPADAESLRFLGSPTIASMLSMLNLRHVHPISSALCAGHTELNRGSKARPLSR
jgi:hypothetical protein